MGQMNIYFPDELEEMIREKAKEENRSISALVVDLAEKQLQRKNFSPEFWKAIKYEEKLEIDRPDSYERRESLK